jgi:hypothetical protein
VAEEAEFSDGDDLGQVAASGQQDVEATEGSASPAQASFKGMNYSKVLFQGVQYDTLDSGYKIGDEVEFLVRGRVKAVGDVQLADGHIRHEVKVKVGSVLPQGESE